MLQLYSKDRVRNPRAPCAMRFSSVLNRLKNMGRPRKPGAVLELTGAFRKNRQRKRTEPPATGPLGDPPEHFTAEQAVVWHELAAACPPGVLTRSGRLLVEQQIDCRSVQRFALLAHEERLSRWFDAGSFLQSCRDRPQLTPRSGRVVDRPPFNRLTCITRLRCPPDRV
jgi:hypothetical protein